jgi:hypothetical protein
MLRESRALGLALAIAAAVVALAALFATLRNPAGVERGRPGADRALATLAQPSGAMAPGSAPDPQRLAAGRAAFMRLDCTRCHDLQGQGNADTPLDGVGARLDAAALRDWTLGTGPAADELPRGILRAKQRAAGDAELDALIDYLQQSR